MGYNTDFCGRFELDKPLTKEHAQMLLDFSKTRHYKRDPEIVKQLDPDWKKHILAHGVEDDLGPDGVFYLSPDRSDSYSTHARTTRHTDYNAVAESAPGLWCQWIPTRDNIGIEWDYGEKFYDYEEWINWLIKNFFRPNGYTLSGRVSFCGESFEDVGLLYVDTSTGLVEIEYTMI